MTPDSLPGRRVPGTHLDGASSATTIIATPDQRHVVIAVHENPRTTCAMTVVEAARLGSLLRAGRVDRISLSLDVSSGWEIVVGSRTEEAGVHADAGQTLLLIRENTSRGRCVASASVAIVHSLPQIDDLVAALAEAAVDSSVYG